MLLVFTSEDRERQAVEINRVRITIGRIAENDVQLVDDKVSRHHAVIEMQDGGRVVLRDLDSRNLEISDLAPTVISNHIDRNRLMELAARNPTAVRMAANSNALLKPDIKSGRRS